jgi:hypothetical protein
MKLLAITPAGEGVTVEINFVSPSRSDKEVQEFWMNDVENTVIQENWIMAHVMANAGVFSSVSQARKNGWNKPIPEGFSQERVGKRKTLITILN